MNLHSSRFRWALCLTACLGTPALFAGIVSVEESNLEPDAPAIIEPNGEGADGIAFDEDVLAYSDRTHQHNGAVFNEETGELDKSSTLIVGLPDYLKGGDFVRFANDTRDNENYSATVTADTLSHFYLLIDNRLDGLKRDASSSNTTDPVLGGSLQWVLESPWKRLNTGISPGGLPDFTGADEGGNGAGPGVGINQFYSVYQYAQPTTSVVVKNQGFNGGSMMALVATPADNAHQEAASLFQGASSEIAFGDSVNLRWLIDPAATVATLEPGVGNILDRIDVEGFGSIDLQPAADTDYTLHVESPAGTVDLTAAVQVNLLRSFVAGSTLVEEGRAVELSWIVRPDAVVTLDPEIGDVSDRVDADGMGSISVVPSSDTTYTLTVTAGDRTVTADVSVSVTPVGDGTAASRFALVDIGALNGSPEPGATGNQVVGGGNSGVNGSVVENVILAAEDGGEFFVSVDNIDPEGNPIGRVDWRDRGGDNNAPLAALARDFAKNNNGMLRLTLAGLPAGSYTLTSYHIDPGFSQAEAIRIGITDVDGVNRDAGVTGTAFFEEGAIPDFADLTTADVEERSVTFSITSNGSDPMIIYFDSTAASDKEVPLSGLLLETLAPVAQLTTFALLDIGASNGQAEAGATGGQLGGAQSGQNGPVLVPTILTSASGREFTLSIDELDPTGAAVGRIDWRDRGDAPAIPLAAVGEDFLKNNNGMVRVVLSGLPEASYEVTSYHVDPDFSQCEAIKILVTDATGTAQDTGVTGSAFVEAGSEPAVAGLTTAFMEEHSATFQIVSNGMDEVILYFDGREAEDKEVPLSGLLLRSSQVSEVTPILSFLSVPTEIEFGAEAALRWRIDPKATSAMIEPGVGDILGQTDTNGSGFLNVSPMADTAYTLTVETPSGTAEAMTVVLVNLVSDFSTSSTFLSDGASATLSWNVRPDATVTIIPGFGDVSEMTNENGVGSVSASPVETTTYTITVSANGREIEKTLTIGVEPQGTSFALLDIGALDGTLDPEALEEGQIGAGSAGENGVSLTEPLELISFTSSLFTVQIDNVNPEGEEVGQLDWRSRGFGAEEELIHLGTDFVKNGLGMIRVILTGLPAGDYNLASYHLDPSFSQCEAIRILVTDANGMARDAGVRGDASFLEEAPGADGLTTAFVQEHSTAFTASSNGVDPVIIYFDGTNAFDDEVPLNGLLILQDSSSAFFSLTEVDRDSTGTVSLSWESTPGLYYDLQKSLTLEPGTWELLVEGIQADPDLTETSLLLESGGLEPHAFYRVAIGRIPAALSEDFEDGSEGWEIGVIDGATATGTSWEVGTPVIGPGMAFSGTQAFGTDLNTDYEDSSLIYLRSPVIDPAGLRNLRLEFYHYLQVLAGEGGRVNLLEEDGTVIQNLDPVFDGADSNTEEWTLTTFRLPNLDPPRPFRVEFEFLSGTNANPENGAGWFIDDVRVSR